MRKIYSAVQMMFFSVAISAIGAVIANIESLSSLGSLMTLVGGIVSIIALYSLRYENKHFSKSLRLFWISVALTILISVLAVVFAFTLIQESAMGPALIVTVFLIILCIVIIVIEIMRKYQLYAGFDEMREIRAFDYPAKRIMWCFYLGIISTIISIIAITAMVLSITSVVSSAGDASLTEQTVLATAAVAVISNVVLILNVAIEAIHLWLIFTYMQAAREALDNEGISGWG